MMHDSFALNPGGETRMSIRRCALAFALSSGFASIAIAGVPAYEFELAARANFTGSFNIPDGFFFSNATPALSDGSGVAATTSGTEAVWSDFGFVVGFNGTIDYTTTGFLGDASVNLGNQIVVEQSLATPEGVILIEGMSAGLAFNVNLFSGYSSPQINNSGRIGYRGQTGGGARLFASDAIGGGLSPAIHVAEVGVDAMSPYSFLFTPSFNNADQIAGKARRGAAGVFGESQPDEIRIWEIDGSSTLIAVDTDTDPMSRFARFDNSVSLTDNGWVAFTSTLAAGGRGVFLSDGTITIEIATEADANVSEIEFFKPAANEDGLVAFRAFNGAGLRAVFVGNGTELVEVATENDIIETDLGPARLDQESASSPVFGGGPDINAAGDVAFFAGVTPPDDNQIEWGTALFIARAQTNPSDLNGDGVVDASDLAILIGQWGMMGVPADLNGDGDVDASDLAILIGAWG
jgi:hypothetical protein